MYGDGRPSQDPCYDSSPLFNEMPTSIVCQKYDFQFDNNVTDEEFDSLDFKWADIVNRSNSATMYQPQFNTWVSGYSINNPTPTPAMNSLNRSATIDPKSGAINMFVVLPANVPANSDRFFITSTQVDAWGYDANGNRIKKATIFRDMPFNIFDCPRNTFTFNDNNGNPIQVDEQNQPPFIQIDSTAGSLSLDTTIYAGDSISLSFIAIDTNVSRCAPTLLSTVTIEPSGFQFDSTFSDARGNCPIQPCATLTPAPTGVSIKKLTGLSAVGTKFTWQTTCDHLDDRLIGPFQSSERVFKFIMKTYDDFCPVPGVQYASINITVKAPEPLGPPRLRCLSENSDGTYTITWSGPKLVDNSNSFDSYELYLGQRAIGSSAPFSYFLTPIQLNITNYNGSFTTAVFAPGQEYAFRMKTKWGCGGLNESALSSAISVTSASAAIQGTINEKGSVLTLDVNDADRYQWFRDGVSIPMSNINTITADSSGLYTVEYFYDSCKFTSNGYQFVYVGLNANNLSTEGVIIYPNPTSGMFSIDFSQDVKVTIIQVFSLDGQLVYSKRDQSQLDLSQLTPNVYLLKVMTNKGMFYKKIVKQ